MAPLLVGLPFWIIAVILVIVHRQFAREIHRAYEEGASPNARWWQNGRFRPGRRMSEVMVLALAAMFVALGLVTAWTRF